MKISKLFGIIGLVTVTTVAQAQSDLVNFTGLGRVYVTHDKLTGDAVQNDSVSKKRATNGYTLFDLGINVSPNENFKGSVILRARNNFGGFYGDGSSLNIRQFRIEGVLGKIVKYQIGDIDLGLTPYTLYNFEEVYHDYESDIFKIRRDIVHYENFNFGNKWRLQGVDAKTTLKFAKIIDKLKLNAFGTRIKRANFSTLEPDRMLYGGRVHVIQSEFFEIGGNLTGVSDLAGTVRDSIMQFDNLVYTSDVKLKYEKDKFELGLMGEFGSSNYSFKSEKNKKRNASYDDYFYDAGLRGAYKPGNFIIGVDGSYREVGAQFSSPGAQTRRINDYAQSSTFDQMNNNTTIRSQTLFDRLSNDQLYNQSIQPILKPFLPEYNNLTPYGLATPNRKGFTGNLVIRHKEKYGQLSFTSENLTEMIGEGTSELRKFSGLRGGTLINIDRILKIKKAISVTGGYRNEMTSRTGPISVDLNSTIIDAGLTVEVLKSVDLMGGYKTFTGNGNEWVAYRNIYSGLITDYYNYKVNSTEDIVSFGLRYRFSNRSFFTGNYQMITYKNKMETSINQNYNIDQLFLNYTLVF